MTDKYSNYFKQLSITKQTFLLFLCATLPIALIIGYTIHAQRENDLIKNINTNAYVNLKSTILLSRDELLVNNYPTIISKIVDALKYSKNILYAYIQKKDEDLTLFVTQDKWKIMENPPESIKNIAGDDFKGEFITTQINDKNESVYHVSMPIKIYGIDWGWLHMGYDLKEFNKTKQESSENTFLYFVLSIILTIIISLYLGNLISKPILKLAEHTKKIASGNLDVYSDIKESKETATLSKNFNEMAKRVKSSQNKLNKINEELEFKVKERTKELVLLNKNLDNNVKQEVKKRREQEDLLIQQSRLAAMGEMIGNIAHQWRQPLNALGLTIQNIHIAYENGYLDENYIKRTVEKSQRLTNQMSQTIDDFRNFFQPTQKKENFSLLKSINNSVEIVDASFKSNNITIEVDIHEDIEFYGYSNQFSQAILNLLSNAKDVLIKSDNPTKTVKFYSAYENGNACLYVEDSGGGIPKDVINEVFTPYFTTKDDGTGIGLYMTKMIIEKNMQSHITVENSDIGAKFKIVFNQNGGYDT